MSLNRLIGFLIFSLPFLMFGENSKYNPGSIDFEFVDESFDVDAWKNEEKIIDKVRLGRVSINIPPPIGFVDITDDIFGGILLELFGQPSFRDHKAYIKKSDFESIDDVDFGDNWEDDYTVFIVRSLKMIENIDCDSVDFAVAKKSFLSNSKEMKQIKERFAAESVKSAKDKLLEFEIIDKEDDFELSGVKTLPIHDSSDRHFSFVQYSKSKLGGETSFEVLVGSLIYVKKRMFYLYGISNNTDLVGKLKFIMKDWSQKIIAQN